MVSTRIQIAVFIVSRDDSAVKIVWFWSKLRLDGKKVMYKILEFKYVWFLWSDLHRSLMILTDEWWYSLHTL